MVRPASDTYYVTVGTILMNLGVPSKLIGCIPKVADRYTTPLAPVTWGITFKTSAYAHDARDVMSVRVRIRNIGDPAFIKTTILAYEHARANLGVAVTRR